MRRDEKRFDPCYHYVALPIPPSILSLRQQPQCLSIVYNQITGGGFAKNMADYGGFLYKEGEGETSCTGASILQHQGVDGGAIHAVDGAVLDWACDIGNNSALAGPAM